MRSGHFQFTSSASPQGVGLHPYTLGWFTSTPSTGAPSDWISQDDNSLVGSREWCKKTKKRQSVGSVRPPTNSALSHAATLYAAAARSCSPLSLLAWPLTLQPSWRAEPLTAPFCLHVHWSMKHAMCQNRDAGILNVNRHHSKLSLNYITVAGLACLACLGSLTVDSAVFCIRNKRKLWSYIHTVWAYIKTNAFYLNYGRGFWFWWWKVEVNLLSVWLQFLCMSTQSGLWSMLLVSLLCGSYPTVEHEFFFFSSLPFVRLSTPAGLTTPSANNHGAVDPETASLHRGST